MKKFRIVLIIALAVMAAIPVLAQPMGGRGPGGFDPDEMIKREKQNVYKALSDLSDDQKMLMDGIYDEFSMSFKEIREEVMQTRDFQNMRPKMEALRAEKDALIQDVLNQSQYDIYLGLMQDRRRQMESMQSGNANRQGRNRNVQPADSLNVQPPQNP